MLDFPDRGVPFKITIWPGLFPGNIGFLVSRAFFMDFYDFLLLLPVSSMCSW